MLDALTTRPRRRLDVSILLRSSLKYRRIIEQQLSSEIIVYDTNCRTIDILGMFDIYVDSNSTMW